MWREKGKSLNHKERIHLRNIHHNNRLVYDRLNFPTKEEEDGYIGKKQFVQKHFDDVMLAPPTRSKLTRRDKMDVGDIEGASPSLNIESIRNRKKHYSHSKSLKSLPSELPADTLDEYIKICERKSLEKKEEKPKRLETEPVESTEGEAKGRARGFEFSKVSILGLYGINPESHKVKEVPKQTVSTVNPTFLTSFKLI